MRMLIFDQILIILINIDWMEIKSVNESIPSSRIKRTSAVEYRTKEFVSKRNNWYSEALVDITDIIRLRPSEDQIALSTMA